MAIKKKLLAFGCLLLAAVLAAQFEEADQFPPGLHWKKIELFRFHLIFPEEMTVDAQRVARILDETQPRVVRSLAVNPEPITLILNNQTIIANGYVTLAPRRAEWFTTPSPWAFAGPIEWYRLLALHEGRHVVQFDKVNQGGIRLCQTLFGEIGRSTATFLTIPMWLFEGDAVVVETGLSPAGRGREPSFTLAARAQLLAGKRFSYAKAYLGSYTDEYLDTYSLGYLMVAWGRKRYDADLWNRVVHRASALSGDLWLAWERALAAETGKKSAAFYREMVDYLRMQWQREAADRPITPSTQIKVKNRRAWTSYTGCQYDEQGRLLAVKYGYGDAPAIVRIGPGGREKKVRSFHPADISSTRISQAGGKIVWSESFPDLRWGRRGYAAIVLLDLESGRARRLLRRTRLHSPVLSPDGSRIAAVEHDTSGRTRLKVLSASDGRELQAFPSPEGEFLLSPAWSEDGNRIALIRLGAQGNALSLLDCQTGKWRHLVPPCFDPLSHPAWSPDGRFVLFCSPINGVTNIQAVESESGRRFQVTSVPLGADFPTVGMGGESLAFSTYSDSGWKLAQMRFDPASWRPLDRSTGDRSIQGSFRLYEPIAWQEQALAQVPREEGGSAAYRVQDYSPQRHLTTIHSWGLGPTDRGLGFRLVSDDTMNLFSWQAAAEMDGTEGTLRMSLGGSYRGWLPLVDFGLSFGGRRLEDDGSLEEPVVDSFQDVELNLGLRLPLNLSRGIYTSTLSAGVALQPTWVSGRSEEAAQLGNGWHLPLAYSLEFNRTRRGAYRDILPRFGQELTLAFRHTPLAGTAATWQLLARARLYFPGLARSHTLRLGASLQEAKRGVYPFSSLMGYPRGFVGPFPERAAAFTCDYVLPLAYPDWTWGSILYVKRLRAGLFLDHARGLESGSRSTFTSLGIDLIADLHLFTTPIPLEMGARVIYRPTDHAWRIEPIVFQVSL